MALGSNATLVQVMDEFNIINNNLQIKKNNIASAITSKGVSASGNESFDNLKNKIDSIVLGRKSASGGTATISTNTNVKGYTVNMNIDFIPSTVFVQIIGDILFSGTIQPNTRHKATTLSWNSMRATGLSTYDVSERVTFSLILQNKTFILDTNATFAQMQSGFKVYWYAYE